MTKEQRRTIEREFYRYKWNKRECENYAVCAVAYDSKASDGERIKSSSGNKNEQLVIRAIYNQEKMLGWCTVFEKTRDKFYCDLKDELMNKKYVENKSRRRICREIGISERTYDYWLSDILCIAYFRAKDLKLL